MRVIKLCKGPGNGVDTACLMTAAGMINGEEGVGDKPLCVCSVIRAFIIPTNDNIDDDSRWKYYGPLPWEIIGTASTLVVRIKRARIAVKYAEKFAYAAAHAAAARATDVAVYTAYSDAAYAAHAADAKKDIIWKMCVQCIREMIAVDPPPKEREFKYSFEDLAEILERD